MARSRVYFVNRFFYPDLSATSQILSGLAFDLAQKGYEVHIATGRQLYENAGAQLPAREVVRGVTVHRVAATRFGRVGLVGRALDYLSFYIVAACFLFQALRRGDVVVAKTDPPLLSILVAPIAWLRGATPVNWLQDVFPEVATAVKLSSRLNGLFAILKPIRNWSLSLAEHNIVIGDRMAGHLVEQGISRSRISVIPNWADPEIVRPIDPSDNALRKEWGFEGRLVIGYSGNLGRVHDIETIVDAIETIQTNPDATVADRSIVFLFVGNGAQRKVLESEIARRKLANVEFRPYQPSERLAESLASADVHLVSLRPELEGFVVPSKVYGVMAAGRPAIFIGVQDGEIDRLIRRFRFGLTVAVGDGPGLAEAILRLAHDPDDRAAMGAAARTAFELAFTKDAASMRWHAFLTRMQASGYELAPSRSNDNVASAYLGDEKPIEVAPFAGLSARPTS